jgi:hypothetical protein
MVIVEATIVGRPRLSRVRNESRRQLVPHVIDPQGHVTDGRALIRRD